jgi:hypothetical protein
MKKWTEGIFISGTGFVMSMILQNRAVAPSVTKDQPIDLLSVTALFSAA